MHYIYTSLYNYLHIITTILLYILILYCTTYHTNTTTSYVETAHAKEGTAVQLNVRGKMLPAQVGTTI